MESFKNKITLYDFFGYVIPGTMILLIIWCMLLSSDISQFSDFIANGFIESSIFFLASYFVGTMIHEISYFIERYYLRKKWNGMPSVRVLKITDNTYNDVVKNKIYVHAMSKLGVEVVTDRDLQHIFNLMKIAVMKEKQYDDCERFNALYGMYKSFFTTSVIISIIVCIKTIYTIINYGISETIVLVFIFLATLFMSFLMEHRTKRFGKYYVKKVIDTYQLLELTNVEDSENDKV